MRFLNGQQLVGRLNLSNRGGVQHSLKDALKRYPDAARLKFPTRPDLLWFSHGLWGLPDPMGPCDQRFKLEREHLGAWQRDGINVLWQTPLNVRTGADNAAYAKAEAVCVREQAQKARVSTFDMISFTAACDLESTSYTDDECAQYIPPNDVHIKTVPTIGLVRGVLLRWILPQLHVRGVL